MRTKLGFHFFGEGVLSFELLLFPTGLSFLLLAWPSLPVPGLDFPTPGLPLPFPGLTLLVARLLLFSFGLELLPLGLPRLLFGLPLLPLELQVFFSMPFLTGEAFFPVGLDLFPFRQLAFLS